MSEFFFEQIDVEAIKNNLPSILKTLQTDDNSSKRYQAVFDIGCLGKEYLKTSNEIQNILITSLQSDSDSGVRAKIAQALSYLNLDITASALITVLQSDTEIIVRWRASRALGTYKLPKVTSALITALQNEKNSRVRNEIAYSLGQIGDDTAIPHLVKMVLNDDEISHTAAFALRYIQSPKAISSLNELLKLVEPEKLDYVIRALELLCSEAEASVKSLIEIIKKQNIDYTTRNNAIIAIGHIGGKEATSFIQHELENEEDSYMRCWYALAHARLLGSNSFGAKLLDEYFSIRYMEEDQISEYRNLKRMWFFEKQEKPESSQNSINKIGEQIMHGESNTIEFKEHLRWNKHTKKVNKDLEFEICKTLTAFMNTKDEGRLIIGISNKGATTGLADDYATFRDTKQNRDGFKHHLNELIKNFIGIEFSSFIEIDIIQYDSKDICVIDVKPSFKPIYIKGRDGKSHFAIRTEGSTEQLDAKQTQQYIENHFN